MTRPAGLPAKCVPSISAPDSATCASIRRPSRGLLDVVVTDLGQVRLCALDRVVQEVTADERALTGRVDPERYMSGGVPGRGLQPHPVTEVRVFVHDVGQSGGDDRCHRVRVHLFDPGMSLLRQYSSSRAV